MKPSKTIRFALGLMLAAVVSGAAGTPLVEVGSPAPELELTSAAGEARSLAAVDGPTVLIFYRGLW